MSGVVGFGGFGFNLKLFQTRRLVRSTKLSGCGGGFGGGVFAIRMREFALFGMANHGVGATAIGSNTTLLSSIKTTF